MRKAKDSKSGVTLVEMSVVFVIIATMLGLLLPAIQYAREAARKTQCQSNLHQLDLAMGQYSEARGRAPNPAPDGAMGGWAIEILPFLEDTALAQGFAGSPPFTDPTALALAGHRPAIMSCPSAYDGDSVVSGIPASHYTARIHRRVVRGQSGWLLGELPTDSRIAWVASPELRPGPSSGGPGYLMPHSGGYYWVQGNGRWADAVVFEDGN